MDYEKIGFKCGIEIHKQLNTTHKLFCNCKARLSKEKPVSEVRRKLRAVAGELGAVDKAALYETGQKKTFIYKIYDKESCLVELDSEPPHSINREALDAILQVALMLDCEIPDEIHVMRKTVVDGSNTSGFQRTAIVGLNGCLETSHGKIGITNVCVEEESAQILERKKDSVVYGLDRLGIPLVEIGTAPDIKNSEHAKEVAEKLGMLLKSTGKVKSGLGTIRQDVNVSVKQGARTEIKGVQKLNLIPKIIENEIRRQIKEKPEIKTVRKANPDGTTTHLRPLPGADRMYPETDIPPIAITKERLSEIELPELLDEKISKFKKSGLNEELAKQIVKSDYLEWFEEFSKKFKISPKDLANLFVNIIPDLKKRKNIDISKLNKKDIEGVLKLFYMSKITKDSFPSIIKELVKGKLLEQIIKEQNPESVSDEEIRKIIRNIIKIEKTDKMGVIVGLAMKELKGKAEGKKIAGIVREELTTHNF